MDLGSIASKVASNPQVQEFVKNKILKDINFPAGKQTIIDKAQQNGADNNIMSFLQKLPDKQYQSQSEVTDELNKSSK